MNHEVRILLPFCYLQELKIKNQKSIRELLCVVRLRFMNSTKNCLLILLPRMMQGIGWIQNTNHFQQLLMQLELS